MKVVKRLRHRTRCNFTNISVSIKMQSFKGLIASGVEVRLEFGCEDTIEKGGEGGYGNNERGGGGVRREGRDVRRDKQRCHDREHTGMVISATCSDESVVQMVSFWELVVSYTRQTEVLESVECSSTG